MSGEPSPGKKATLGWPFSFALNHLLAAEPVQFTEVWNLVKPADGSSGWLLAGIQQMH